MLGSDGVAVVIDPQRDVDQYIDEAFAQGLQIRHILETHVHADFVSGHRELAQRTGAEIVLGWRSTATFPHRAVHDGDEIPVGSLRIRILEAPGHTPEAIFRSSNGRAGPGEAPKLFTGDTLFIGDVGRPDLVGSKGYTAEEMASLLYDSLHDKLLALNDAVAVFPAHGAGSLCGRNISTETSSTIGEQRRNNYALQPMSKDEFITMMTTGLPDAPASFGVNAQLNLGDVPPLDQMAARAPFLHVRLAITSTRGPSPSTFARPSNTVASTWPISSTSVWTVSSHRGPAQ